jgi:seryl-tRNA synthetase
VRAGTASEQAFLDDLLDARLLVATGAPGVYGRGAAFESVLGAVDALVSRAAAPDGAESLRFPPILPRETLERSGYLKSFPHLAGSVFSFDGSEAEAAELDARSSRHDDWSGLQQMTDVVLVPAACYPVYPAIAARGPLPPGGHCVDAGGAYVFRHEPSGDPARLQMFHQRELVRLGAAEDVLGWRQTWIERAVGLLRSIGLDAQLEVANDPFFGRAGRMLAANQREQGLKFEVVVPIASDAPTAVSSFNWHQDHFGIAFGISLADGGTAQTACLGFGLERIALALHRAHGLDAGAWPATVTETLWPA